MSGRAFSGSSVSVVVIKVIRRGRRERVMLWSADVLGDERRRERMQFEATLAVCSTLDQKGKVRIGEREYHSVT